MEENLRATLAVFAAAKPTGQTKEFPGLAVAASDVNFSMFNTATLTAPVLTLADLERRIAAADSYYASRGLPWSCWVCQSWLEPDVRAEASDLFVRSGLHLAVELPGMEAEHILPPVRVLPQLDFVRVSGRRSRRDFSQIMAATFGIPWAVSSEVYESDGTWRAGFTGWVAYSNGLPVAAAATTVSAGVIGVYAVGTLPVNRRRGFGEAVMRHALAQARRESDLERTVLQSSEAGFALYQRMGYQTVARYWVFVHP
jgi:GNAT superfamily N-acetyltransferase